MLTQIEVGYKKRPRSILLTPSRKPIGKALFHGSKYSAIRGCFSDPVLFKIVVKKMSSLLQKEVCQMCSLKANSNSALRYSSKNELPLFTWEGVVKEMSIHSPTLLHFLTSLTTYNKRNKSNSLIVIGMCAAILCKYKCPSMIAIQKLISVAFYCGHSSKQVYS